MAMASFCRIPGMAWLSTRDLMMFFLNDKIEQYQRQLNSCSFTKILSAYLVIGGAQQINSNNSILP